MPHRFLSLEQGAEYLHLTETEVRELIKTRDIPFQVQGDRVVFQQVTLDAWASQRILGFNPQRLERFHQKSSVSRAEFSSRDPILPELLKPEYIAAALKSKTRPAVIRDMVALAQLTNGVNDPDDLIQSLRDREELCSTALPGGFAVLHPRHQDPYAFQHSFLLLGRALHPIPYGAPDGGQTDLFFLLGCENDRIHLHLLARLCMIARQEGLLESLRQAEAAAAIYERLLAAEQQVLKNL